MFSGIVEACLPVKRAWSESGVLRVSVEKPPFFNDLEVGDSICTDGVCLTIESFSKEDMQFAIAAETLQVWQCNEETLGGRPVNLERSLRYGDRIHGHLVTGHVEGRTPLLARTEDGGSVILEFRKTPGEGRRIWRKGSVALNGVSLTVNDVNEESFTVCLIPETLKRTNLQWLKEGESVNIETDYYAKALQSQIPDSNTRETL